MNALFQGRSTDLWEMAETLAGYGCESSSSNAAAAGSICTTASHRIPAGSSLPIRFRWPTLPGPVTPSAVVFWPGYRSSYDPLHAALTGNISASMVIEGSHPYYALDALPGLAKARLEALRDRVRKA
jgi:hypothetical protein